MEGATSVAAQGIAYDEEKVMVAFSNTVDEIRASILANRILHMWTPTDTYPRIVKTTISLNGCDKRTQKIYCIIISAVKEQLKNNPVLVKVADLESSAPLFLHFALQPTKDLIAKLDKEQKDSVDDLIKRAVEEGVRVTLKDLEIMARLLNSLHLSDKRLSDLKLDRAELLTLSKISALQQKRLDLLKVILGKYGQ